MKDAQNRLPPTLMGFYFKYGFKPFKWIFVVWLFLMFVREFGYDLLYPMATAWFVALLEAPLPEGADFLSFAMPTIWIVFAAVLAVNVLNTYQWKIFRDTIGVKIQDRLSQVLYKYIHCQSVEFFHDNMPGRIAKQTDYIVDNFNIIVFRGVRFVIFIFTLGIMSIMLFRIHQSIAIAILIGMVFSAVWSIMHTKRFDKATEKFADATSELQGKLVDSLSSYQIVKSFSGAKHEHKLIKKDRDKTVRRGIQHLFRGRVLWVPPMIITYAFLMPMVMFLCAKLYAAGEIRVSEVVFALTVYMSITDKLDAIISEIPEFASALGMARQSYSELVRPASVEDMPDAKRLSVKRGLIEINKLSFGYGKRHALNNINLSIKPGQRVGIVGASGAGKSTLVGLLMRFYDPSNGQVLVDGQDIKSITQDSLRESISFIPQDPAMFNRTLYENISYGRKRASQAQVRRAAKQAHADHFIQIMPKKYSTLVGDRGIRLSGGQRQRIAIARAFLKNAPILILDEATSALDSATETLIQRSFEKLSHGRTTIAIAHRLSTLRNMDRIIVLEKGCIIEDGTPAQLIKKGGAYAKMWKMQSGGFIKSEK
ncbi:MAG: ABC transporter ATP-binding protein/permease [Alphaproteobacteria bacterium]|nr:ABC transporter ATP-binding protein/permease [Alphaproteobacteria bacterium]